MNTDLSGDVMINGQEDALWTLTISGFGLLVGCALLIAGGIWLVVWAYRKRGGS